jgi:hypothetical protein
VTRLSGIAVFIALALSTPSAAFAQVATSLRSLTVPARSLPSGCALTPVDPKQVSVPAPFPANPWVGTDYQHRLTLRRAIDGRSAGRFPDAPPLTPREVSALESKWADDVVEGYRATYSSATGGQIQVSAVRFNDARWATSDSPLEAAHASRRASFRIVRGATAILVTGAAYDDCFNAISGYIRTLK